MKNITGYDFTNDMNKMHDFMLLSMDEFLSSYSYLNEDDYYATYNAIMGCLKKSIHIWKWKKYRNLLTDAIKRDNI